MVNVIPSLLLLSSLTNVARAHRGVLTRPSCGSDFASSETALTLPDASISWAFRHYLDCTARGIWVELENPTDDFSFYVGVGVPTLERFADIRASALIIGPGLPPLPGDVFTALPAEIQQDPIWDQTNSIGAYYHVSPQDQSTCNHLGVVMTEASTVVNNRCDFFEPFSQTHSWRVLDADNNILPLQGETYHVVVWSQNEDVSTKLSVALGTWVEDFRTPYEIATPSCQRSAQDFFEKQGLQEDCFPVLQCSEVTDLVGCQQDFNSSLPVCDKGQVCQAGSSQCTIAGVEYEAPMTGSCGGELCPAAVQEWETVNQRMHRNMMDIEYTGNLDIDFVRNMIPHHSAALDMCHVLLQELTCTDISDIDNLEGLVHFCQHVQVEQEREVAGMKAWLQSKGLEESAPCMTGMMQSADAMMTMAESCGLADEPSSQALIGINNKMHAYMAIEYSCDHSVDFVRMMLPHHASAVEMCDLLTVESSDDNYLQALCTNITKSQRAEIAWMHEWLAGRNLTASAPCDSDCEPTLPMSNSCEDLLSTSSFCHGLDGQADGYCSCATSLKSGDLSCTVSFVEGVGVFNPSELCRRGCSLCDPEESSVPLWPHDCYDPHSNSGHNMHGGSHGGDGTASDDEVSASLVRSPLDVWFAAAMGLIGVLLIG